ncbi:hypothetical protein DUI87_09531 [Hirundo rustica rustica]|uniref:Uncharacterized protein n=1 Tax=Hirundo rustica rustica TaxID=333673 RepID=A0A3M0KMV4_HIRRU|nr:hypothetical protein DUI87_09531 [Hirundo rustica rustica]
MPEHVSTGGVTRLLLCLTCIARCQTSGFTQFMSGATTSGERDTTRADVCTAEDGLSSPLIKHRAILEYPEGLIQQHSPSYKQLRKTKLEVIQALPGKLPAESPVATSHGVNGMSWIDVEQIDLACGRLGKQQEILQLCKAKSSSTSLCSMLMAMPDCTRKEFALPTGADQ